MDKRETTGHIYAPNTIEDDDKFQKEVARHANNPQLTRKKGFDEPDGNDGENYFALSYAITKRFYGKRPIQISN